MLNAAPQPDLSDHVSVLVACDTDPARDVAAIRLIHALMADDRYSLLGLVTVPPADQPRLGLPQRLATWETRLVPPPRRTPLPDVTWSAIAQIPIAAVHRQPKPDVVIDLSRDVTPELIGVAHRGLWHMTGQAESAWTSSYAGQPATAATLYAHHFGTDPIALSQASYDTKTLASHNAAYTREKSVQLILRALADTHLAQEAGADAASPRIAPQPRPSLRGTLPGYLRHVSRDISIKLRDRIAEKRQRTFQPFTLRMGHGTPLHFNPAQAVDVAMTDNRYWADPFLIAHRGETYCFFEDLDPAVGFAHISVGRVDGLALSDVHDALRLPMHMSYPFVFEDRGDIFMIPETHQAGRLEIWRARRFPDDWELFSAGLEGTPVCDSTLLQRGADWWLFTHICNDSFGDFCNELHVFWINGPDLKQIVPHRLNPVVIDAATARGAGRFHQIGGKLFRPSQDNSGGSYGYGLNLMEVLALDLDRYQERRIRHITPDFDRSLIGCHHFDALDGQFVLDVRHRR